jgi:hypothetical protein
MHAHGWTSRAVGWRLGDQYMTSWFGLRIVANEGRDRTHTTTLSRGCGGAPLSMAAHLELKHGSVLDLAGLAQRVRGSFIDHLFACQRYQQCLTAR